MASRSARTSWLAGGLTAALVFLLGQFLPAVHARLEAGFYDRILRAVDDSPGSRVVLVRVDGPSIDRLGPPPWAADIHASLINRLSAAGARVSAFTGPLGTQEDERVQAALRLLESSDTGSAEERDRLRALLATAGRTNGDVSSLSRAMSANGRVVMPLPVSQSARNDGGDLVPGDARLVVSSDLLHRARQFDGIQPPPNALSKAAAAAGHTALIPDADGVVRRDFIAVRVGTVLVPSLATAIALTALQQPLDKLRFEDERTLALGTHRFTLEAELTSLSHPLQSSEVTTVSYAQVLQGDSATMDVLHDAMVLIEPTTTATSATVTTPLGNQDEALVLAAAATSLIDHMAFRHTMASVAIEWALALTMMLLAAFALPRLRLPTAGIVVVLVVGALLILEFVVLAAMGLWLQLMLPGLALIAGFIGFIVWAAVSKGSKQSREDNANLRSLGQTFHRQGQLDLAFETFRRCPMDTTTMDLLYALGSDYERRHQYPKALAVYSFMGAHDAGYRDLRTRRAQVIRRGTEHQKQLAPQKPSGPAVATEPSLLDPATSTWPPTPQRSPARAAPKRMLGRYEIERELGKGAMGVVYLGRDPKINRVVAIKAIPLAEEFEEEDLAEARARFFREAEMAGRLNHPAIVTVYDAGEDQGLAYIAMEYLRGQHLSHFADAARLLPPKNVMMLAARVADALHYAHRQNVVHRDIKPANIMFNPDADELKITDFGIARLTDASRTKTGIVLGTPSFMSPEQLEGRSLDGRSDLFALGVSLYQLLTGQLPFRADSMPRLMQKIATEPHAPINVARPDLPACIVGIIDKTLSKNPEDRYQNGAELAAALRSCAQSEDVQW
ncbi:MAG: serine/threonine-protein kinase [Steroidobacteraceae bacterium]